MSGHSRTTDGRVRHDPARITFYDNVGACIRRVRMAADISQKAMADHCGISQGMLSQIEGGVVHCSLYVASRVADAVDGTIDDIAPVTIDTPEEA